MIRLSGRLRSAVIIGLQGIRARKTRTLLSMISLFLGVLSVTVVQAASQMAQRAALADVELIEGIDGTLYMSVEGTPEATNATLRSLEGRSDATAITQFPAIIGEPNVRPVNEGGSPFDEQWGGWGWSGGSVRIECDPTGYCYEVIDEQYLQTPIGAAIELRVVGMSADIRQFRPFRLVAGQWLDFSTDPSYSPGLVLNREAAKGFEMYRVPAEMRIMGASDNPTPRILGVVEDGQRIPMAYGRLDELLNWVNVGAGPDPYYGGIGLEVLVAPDATETLQVLRANLAAAGIGEDRLYVRIIDSRRQVEQVMLILRVVFFGMAGLVLLIGVAGILNVTLATVGERVEEFALRRAVGTPRMLLAGIVLAETMITGLFTAAAAIGFAALVFKVAGPILAEVHYSLAAGSFPWEAALAGIIAGLFAGLLGGLIPAVRAARIPIASVMRA
ncbi:MAG: ABC transporter permease [Micromonosporaceae bacterium]|nr:ABC transporter permease [Micromonosporaceae bacterium]